MLQIVVPPIELWDAANEEFINIDQTTLYLEHSLVSVSKWEEKWHKSFLYTKDKSKEETISYIKYMCLNKHVNPLVFSNLSNENYEQIMAYVSDNHTATTFSKKQNENSHGKKATKIVTSELIYYWMIAYGVPHEYERWHLNRLMTLIRICAEYNAPDKKKKGKGASKDYLKQRNTLNAARLAKAGGHGTT